MGVTERKERGKQELHALILQAARQIFLEEGYEKTSIRKIAERIEYSPATIYLHFKDKNDLLLALHREAFQHFYQNLLSVAEIQDAFDRLETIGKRYIQYGLDNPSEYELMFVLIAPMDALDCREEIWNDGRIALDILKKILIDCVTAGYFRSTLDIEAASIMLWSQVHGITSLHLHNRFCMLDETARIELPRRAFQLMLDTVKKSW